MTTHVYLVLATPKDGKEAEFNDFYEGQHIPDVLRVDGFVRCTRLRLASDFQSSDGASPYAALYELETADAPGAIRELRSRLGTPSMPTYGLADPAKGATFLYEVISRHGER